MRCPIRSDPIRFVAGSWPVRGRFVDGSWHELVDGSWTTRGRLVARFVDDSWPDSWTTRQTPKSSLVAASWPLVADSWGFWGGLVAAPSPRSWQARQRAISRSWRARQHSWPGRGSTGQTQPGPGSRFVAASWAAPWRFVGRCRWVRADSWHPDVPARAELVAGSWPLRGTTPILGVPTRETRGRAPAALVSGSWLLRGRLVESK